jgi:Uma2 family endonuclease
MSAPNANHAGVSAELNYSTKSYIKQIQNSEYSVYYAPIDVFFSDEDVVQPDILVCKKTQMELKGCIGAPALIIEILSPSNSKRDLIDKFLLYEKHGVKEYWIANPKTKVITLYSLEDGKYKNGEDYIMGETITSCLFPDLKINLDDIFKDLL